jgi:hypothetical protein
MYPPYQPLTYNIANTTEKLDVEVMVGVLDAFNKLGVTLIPKQRWAKYAHTDFTKGGYSVPDRETAIAYQKKSAVSGWVALPFLSEVSYAVIDIDSESGVEKTYNEIQTMCPTQMVFRTPSGGYHLWYRVPEGTELNNSPSKGVEVRHNGVRSPITVAGTAHYIGDNAGKKQVPDGHLGYYQLIGAMDPAQANDKLLEYLKPKEQRVHEPFAATAVGSSAVSQHEKLSPEQKIQVVQEALDWAFKSAMAYDRWLSVWMSAWVGTDGAEEVCEYIVNHPLVAWSDGAVGQEKFRRAWQTHVPKQGGYTVATLYYAAYENGWLSQSPADLGDNSGNTISVARISDWIESQPVLPKNLLLMSQTGSGKTYGFKTVYQKLGEPRTVVIVPTSRLAMDMAKKLETLGLPAVPYRATGTLEIQPTSVLVGAKILVTTLQTFTKRLFVEGENFMSGYGLVWLEECDQLLISFARSLGEDASHVDHIQSVAGFTALREAFLSTAYVWGVDATTTMVSYYAFKSLCSEFQFIKNTHVTPKPPVRWLNSRMEAYSVVAQSLSDGCTVVAPCDTKREAELLVKTMVELGVVTEREALAVTADMSAIDRRVLEYSSDANTFAPQYRLVAYNSAMASGVSVDEHRPDVVVQISTGYLPPRVALQLLNRYRKQDRVYVWYNAKKTVTLVGDVSKHVADQQTTVAVEADTANLTLAERSENAALRDQLRAIAALDEKQQRRNPALFYRALLAKNDGRASLDEKAVVIGIVEQTHDAMAEGRKERRAELAENWHTVEPYADPSLMPDTFGVDQIQYSLAHYWIKTCLNGNVPSDCNPSYVYDTVRRLYKKTGALTAFVKQADAIRKLEKAYANDERGVLTLPPTVARILLAASLRYLFDTPETIISDETLEQRALPFWRYLRDNSTLYHAVVKQPDGTLDSIEARSETVTERVISAVKRIGNSLGLRIRSRGVGLHIENLQQVKDYLSWYYGEETQIAFERLEFEQERQKRVSARAAVARMNANERKEFYSRLTVFPVQIALAGVSL